MALHIRPDRTQIPPNTGNIARLCAATDTTLHLIEPLGFSMDDAQMKRAGLDYWDAVDLWVHPDWFAFRDAMARERCLYFSARDAELSQRRRTGRTVAWCSGARPRECRSGSWRSTRSSASPFR